MRSAATSDPSIYLWIRESPINVTSTDVIRCDARRLAERVGLLALQEGSRAVNASTEEGMMFKSSRRDKAEGRLERLVGRLLEFVGRVTGRGSSKKKVKGKAARTRGTAKRHRGRAKQRVSR